MFSSMQSGKGEQIFFKASEHGLAVLMLEAGRSAHSKRILITMKSLTKTTRYVSLDQPYEFGKLRRSHSRMIESDQSINH